MILDPNILNHNTSMARYIAGEMSADEAKWFDDKINSHPDNILLINEMKNNWRLIGKANIKAPDVDSAWNNIYTKFKNESLIDKKNEIQTYRQQWVQWAAVIILVFTVGSAILFSNGWQSNIVILSTSDPNTLVHTLPDGSTVYLIANTKLTYTKKYGEKTRKVSLLGEAFFEVMPNFDKPFIVETREVDVMVLGTSFTVKSNSESEFEVVVETGSVSVSSKDSKIESMVAIAGDKVTWVNNNLAKISTSTMPFQKLKNERLQFKDESVANIILIINKTYNTNIVLEEKNLGNRKITVTFHNNTVSSIIDVICATLGLQARYDDNTVTLWHP